MKKIIWIILFTFFTTMLFPQETTYIPPQFAGGDSAFHDYLYKNLNYPIFEVENYILGKSFARIYVDKSGKIALVLVDGSNENFNNAVKKCLISMPKWIPGKLNNQEKDTVVHKIIYFSMDFSHRKNDNTIYECMIYRNPITEDENVKQKSKALALWRNGLYEFENKDYEFAIEFFKNAELNGMTEKNLYYYRGIAYFNISKKDLACKDWTEAVKQGDAEADELLKSKCQ